LPRPVWLALEIIPLLIILVIAAGLRLGYLGTVEYMQDEANFSRYALDIVRGRDFPLLSIDSSVGIRNPPMTVYIMVIPYLLTNDPVLATAYVGVLGVLTVLVLYGVVRHYYGLVPAICVGLLLATNPWLVMVSRKIWDLLPLFLALTLTTGVLGFVDGKRWAQLLHVPLLSVIGQIHYATVALVPITLFLIVIGRKRIKREFWWSVPLTVLITLPFLIGAAREGYFRPEIIQKLGKKGGQPIALTLSDKALRESVYMISGVEAYFAPGQQRYPDDVIILPEGSAPLVIGFAAVLIGAILWLLIRARKRDRRTIVDVTFLLCFGTTLLMFIPTWTTLFTHYLLPVLIAGLVIIGIAAGDLWRLVSKNRMARFGMGVLGVAMFGVVTLIPAANFWAHLGFVDKNPTPGVFTVPLRYYMPVRAALLRMQPKAILASVDGQFIGFNREASIWDTLLYDIPLRRFTDPNIEVYPTVPTPFLAHRCREGTQNFYFRTGEGCLSLEMRSRADFKADQYQPFPQKVALENGIKPLYYRWMSDTACLEIVWTPAHAVPEDWQAKAHFADASGKVIAYGDGAFWRGRYWQAGDLIVRRHCLSNPADAAKITEVRIGMYLQNGDQFQNLNVLDERGAAIGQEIVLSLQPKLEMEKQP
jgi:hypothetical protein